MPVVIAPAVFPDDTGAVRDLLREYADALGVDLSFQDFKRELNHLPGEYAPPSGTLLIAVENGWAAGLVGLRKLDAATCEMKRLFVRPMHRGTGLGRRLAEAAIADARRKGYARMRLDTLPSMKEAHALYDRLGFKPIPAYRANPVPGAAFLELALARRP